MRLALATALSLTLAACTTTAPPSVAQQTQAGGSQTQAGGSARAQVNAIRTGANRQTITRSSALDAAARTHAKDMAARNFFSHTGSNGSTVGARARKAGYRWCYVSENISKGYATRAAAIEGWRKSKGHYRNLVNPKAQQFGLAREGDVWVMVLAAKSC